MHDTACRAHGPRISRQSRIALRRRCERLCIGLVLLRRVRLDRGRRGRRAIRLAAEARADWHDGKAVAAQLGQLALDDLSRARRGAGASVPPHAPDTRERRAHRPRPPAARPRPAASDPAHLPEHNCPALGRAHVWLQHRADALHHGGVVAAAERVHVERAACTADPGARTMADGEPRVVVPRANAMRTARARTCEHSRRLLVVPSTQRGLSEEGVHLALGDVAQIRGQRVRRHRELGLPYPLVLSPPASPSCPRAGRPRWAPATRGTPCGRRARARARGGLSTWSSPRCASPSVRWGPVGQHKRRLHAACGGRMRAQCHRPARAHDGPMGERLRARAHGRKAHAEQVPHRYLPAPGRLAPLLRLLDGRAGRHEASRRRHFASGLLYFQNARRK